MTERLEKQTNSLETETLEPRLLDRIKGKVGKKTVAISAAATLLAGGPILIHEFASPEKRSGQVEQEVQPIDLYHTSVHGVEAHNADIKGLRFLSAKPESGLVDPTQPKKPEPAPYLALEIETQQGEKWEELADKSSHDHSINAFVEAPGEQAEEAPLFGDTSAVSGKLTPLTDGGKLGLQRVIVPLQGDDGLYRLTLSQELGNGDNRSSHVVETMAVKVNESGEIEQVKRNPLVGERGIPLYDSLEERKKVLDRYFAVAAETPLIDEEAIIVEPVDENDLSQRQREAFRQIGLREERPITRIALPYTDSQELNYWERVAECNGAFITPVHTNLVHVIPEGKTEPTIVPTLTSDEYNGRIELLAALPTLPDGTVLQLTPERVDGGHGIMQVMDPETRETQGEGMEIPPPAPRWNAGDPLVRLVVQNGSLRPL